MQFTVHPPRPRGIIDIDGCAADYTQAVVDLYNDYLFEQHGSKAPKFTVDDCTQYSIFDSLNMLQADRAEMSRRIRSEGFCARLPVYRDAVHALTELKSVADLYVVTSPLGPAKTTEGGHPSPYWIVERDAWVERELGIHKKYVTHSHCKELCGGQFIIEDKPENIAAWCAVHHDGIGIVMDRPWNRSSTVTNIPRVYRAYGWIHAMEIALEHLRSEKERYHDDR